MERITFDYSKLKGKIIEKYGSQTAFAKALGVSDATMTSKMTGKTYFSQDEIMKSIVILGINPGAATEYFFTVRV